MAHDVARERVQQAKTNKAVGSDACAGERDDACARANLLRATPTLTHAPPP